MCGVFQHERPKDKPAKPRWFGYISVPNVEKAEKAIVKAGGRTLAPTQKFPKRGEQAVFADAEGALFGVVKSSSGDPEDFKPGLGDWIWIQLLSRDGRKAAEFYRTIGGYEIIENTANNKLSDYVLTSEGFARATVRTIPKERQEVVPTWLPFVRVKSVNQSVEDAKQYGGKVLVEPNPEVLEGKVAVVADPTGAAVGLLEWSESPLEGGR
jgi:predicted enzyme related to lactoylglutathione lyase